MYESTWEEEDALENAKTALRRFQKQQQEEDELLAGIFKGVESETGESSVKV